MSVSSAKQNGVHYTPPELAQFLAGLIYEQCSADDEPIRVLDPACGDGTLLGAIHGVCNRVDSQPLVLAGYETDERALHRAQDRLASLKNASVELCHQDFLSIDGIHGRNGNGQLSLFDAGESELPQYDCVIANPPYVRTQVLGAKRSQELARRFDLTGRVDLYQAFTRAMANVLKPGGVLGLLTSNRFLTIRAGATLRSMLRTEFDLLDVYDLGDTKLFSAAVLPVIVIAVRKTDSKKTVPCGFHRVYESRSGRSADDKKHASVLAALRDRAVDGVIEASTGQFLIERGTLRAVKDSRDVWTMSSPGIDDWLRRVKEKELCRFADVVEVRVGIKTTADDVFVRSDWSMLPASMQPESELLHPLLTQRETMRWQLRNLPPSECVLYPHVMSDGQRRSIELDTFPGAKRYLTHHHKRLQSRTYVTDAGRKWYEIWVPHCPTDWAKPKVVFPDIAEEPRFCLDLSGALVQGNCYWMTLKEGVEPDWLYLILAVANSSLATRFYDVMFHNKLYSGRRRYMTQYVRKFPLPDLTSDRSQEIVQQVRRITSSPEVPPEADALINSLVWKSFGQVEEVTG